MLHKEYQHWKITVDSQNILWLGFDKYDENVNSFNEPVLQELEVIVEDIRQSKVKGMILHSLKAKGFIAGADIKALSSFTEVDEAISFIRYGQRVFDKIEDLPMPTLSLINGFCMGGGLEISLACRYRIALDAENTRLALPEVMLGIHPGWGGTVRLPKLIGAPKAMDLILSGRGISAKAAKKMGVVDEAVPERHLKTAAVRYILGKPAPHKAGFFERLTNHFVMRHILARVFIKTLSRKIKEAHYPAPFAVVRNWKRYGVHPRNEAMITEANSIGELLLTDTPKNLIRVFKLSERMKEAGKNSRYDIKHVHVIGAGIMGGDIAALCALKGFRVTLEDREAKFLSSAFARAAKLFQKKLKDPMKARMALDRLIPDVKGEGVKTADVIIEAIFENLEAKQALFKRVESQAKIDAVLASNTSSIMIEKIAQSLSNPSRLIGIHFFNPVAKMPLVEIVQGEKSDLKEMDKALAFAVKLGKQPLAVKSSPGFLVNRVLTPYLMEAMTLLEEGTPASVIDKVAVDFGMPMGPVELADTVGLDICLSVAKNLSQYFNASIPKRLTTMVEQGQLGKKTGQGFYLYKKGKKIVPKTKSHFSESQKELMRLRLVYRLLNESVACLREGIITDKDFLDAGIIFGTGFAPFLGGPLNYLHALGKDKVSKELGMLHEKYGDRFPLSALEFVAS